jgi:O-antigen/teichoic acid export membrane protein
LSGCAAIKSSLFVEDGEVICCVTAFQKFSRPRTGVIVDQALYSLQNFALLLLTLHVLPLEEVGQFGLVYGVFAIAIVTGRGLYLEVLLTRQDLLRKDAVCAAIRSITGAALLVALSAMAALSLVSLFTPPNVRELLLLAGAALSPILVQDALRYRWLATPRTWVAAGNDLLSLAASAVLAIALLATMGPSVEVVMLIWSGGALSAALPVLVGSRALPSIRLGVRWCLTHRDVGLPLAATCFATQLGARAVVVLTGSIAGFSALGQFNASMAIMAPMNVILMAAGTFGIAEASRRHGSGPDDLSRAMWRLSVGLLAAALGFFVVYLLTPDGLGQIYLGSNWAAAERCVLPVAVWTAAIAVVQGPRCGLRVLGLNRTIFGLGSSCAVLQTAAAAAGALVGGVVAAAWGLAVATWICTLVAIWVFVDKKAASRESPATARALPAQAGSEGRWAVGGWGAGGGRAGCARTDSRPVASVIGTKPRQRRNV